MAGGGERRVSSPMMSVAQIMDWTWRDGQQFAVMPTNFVRRQYVLRALRKGINLTFTSSVIRLRYMSVQQPSDQYGKKGPRILAFNMMNFLYFLYKSLPVKTSA